MAQVRFPSRVTFFFFLFFLFVFFVVFFNLDIVKVMTVFSFRLKSFNF